MKNKNLLVQYQGGGYDGCVWEWNFFIFDNEGEFQDIYSSGCAGVKDEDAARKKLDEIREEHERAKSSSYVKVHGYIYSLTDAKSMREFCLESNATHVMGVMQSINEYYDGTSVLIHTEVYCSCCGQPLSTVFGTDDDIYQVSLASASGRCSGPFYYQSVLCGNCYDDGTCYACRETNCDEPYCGQENLSNGLCWFHEHLHLLRMMEDGTLVHNEDTKWVWKRYGECPGTSTMTYGVDDTLDELLRDLWSKIYDQLEEYTKKPSWQADPRQLTFKFGEQDGKQD